MPSATSIPHRRRREVDSDEEEEASSRSTTPFSQSSNGNKRARLGPRDDNDDDEEEEEDDDDDDAGTSSDGSDSTARHGRPTAEPVPAPGPSGSIGAQENDASASVGPGEYRAGAIVRVKLTDFVTYTSAEFFPGPRLNMVIGPNGTGKSTLVCAICLGLGWGPQHLGRAKDPAEFVKHGCREATIEIELASGGRYRRNPIISRTIVRDGNKSTFAVNGKPSTKTRVLELAKSFSIQIDNLCQFLPQDKVSEFAALTPVELLHSTQRAAAPPEVLEWHQNLITLRSSQKSVQSRNSGDKEMLDNLKNRQEVQREDVERMRQREVIKQRLELLELVRPIPRMTEARTVLNDLKTRRVAVQREQAELEAQEKPALDSLNAKREYVAKYKAVVDQKRLLVDRADTHAVNVSKKMQTAEEFIKDLEAQIQAEKIAASKQRDERKKLQQTINRITNQIENEPVHFDAADFAERIRDATREIRELEDKNREMNEANEPLARSFTEKKSQLAAVQAQLRNLDSQSGRQEAKLERASPDSSKAWKWIKEHRGEFEQEVFGPPLVVCSVKDPKYADALESLLQKSDLTAFTTQTRNDFRRLQRVLFGEMKLHDITLKTCSAPLSNFRAPLNDGELRSLGFDTWAKDLISGPEPVLAMLCSENGFHRTPLVLRDISEEQYNRLLQTEVSVCVSGTKSYRINRRREYGPGATSVAVRSVRSAQFWTSQPVDAAAKANIESRITAYKNELDELQQQVKEQNAAIHRLRSEHDDAKARKAQVEMEKSTKQTAYMTWQGLPVQKAQCEEKCSALEGQNQRIRKSVAEIREKQIQYSLQRAQGALEYAIAVEGLRKMHEDLIRTEIRFIEATSDYETLKERNQEVNQTLEAKREEVAVVIHELQAANRRFKAIFNEASELLSANRSNQMFSEIVGVVKDYDVAQLEADIDSEKARLELTHEGSSRIIEEFEHRQRQIDKLQDKLFNANKELEEIDTAIAELRGKWEPKLEALVQKISNAFSDSFARIGCAGQVSVDKCEDITDNETEPGTGTGTGLSTNTDFDQWSIRIQVKFREHEQLSVLDSHRQSGGERAVSTIFYLMALQSLSASPFRVVDEINQGMDPRNERMVHERMVDIACSSGGGQYFLITPKLLSGLVYRRGMKVLCIVSGEYMPEEYQKVDFGRCVDQMKDVVATRRRGRDKSGGRDRGGTVTMARSSGVGVAA
ncbi:hypothetical protein AJ80_09616 [Polytolypa hystricis UAMH7299]|uniref:Structural maintenance of chromosomes protein 5 n=1 Tax=Polytolypa hystricis (strain UAMH7299) TaxID=1447883 RepID=A0A2B7WN38_POLH7|nr:hypothetical protein AJ80_09616 [Polytolypa hystricis UAMH7299]